MYVQAYGGSDTVGTGDINSPVATLSKALEVVKKLKSDGYTDKVQILMGEGRYNVSSNIVIRNNNVPDGGLVISGKYGEDVVLTATTDFNLSEAVKVTDSATLDRLHSQNAKNNLYVLDLTTKIALNDIAPVKYPGTYSVSSWLSQTGLENPTSYDHLVLFDDKLMNVSRYPNSGYATMGTITDGGIEARFMLPEYDGTETDLDVTKENLLKGFEFKSGYENLSKWQTADQALMFGYFYYDWATQTVPLKEVNTANGTVRSKYPSYYGAREGGRYYVYNLLEEIDLPGEYFLDRKAGKLYFYMPQNAKADSVISFSNTYTNLIYLSGASNVTIDSLDITGVRGGAIVARGSNNVTVSNCEISNISSMAVDLTGENNIVKNCYIHDVNGGITLNSTDNTTAINTMTLSNSKAINNEIENFSIINKTYTPAITLYGAGNQAINNEIHESEHMAIRYSGYGHLIKGNEVYNVCKEVDDSGAVYVGRTWTNRGTKIINNYFHDINSTIDSTNTVCAVYFDDHFAGGYVEGNIFANIDGDGVRGNGGREHVVTNNIFVNCSERSTYMPDNNYNAYTAESVYATQISGAKGFIGNALWEEAYPLMFTTDEGGNTVIDIMEMKEPASHTFTNNLCVKAPFYYGPRATTMAVDISGNYTTDVDPGFKDMENGNYSIEESVVKALIPNFRVIDFSAMGRY